MLEEVELGEAPHIVLEAIERQDTKRMYGTFLEWVCCCIPIFKEGCKPLTIEQKAEIDAIKDALRVIQGDKRTQETETLKVLNKACHSSTLESGYKKAIRETWEEIRRKQGEIIKQRSEEQRYNVELGNQRRKYNRLK